MFDLFRSRAKAVRIMLTAILSVVAAAMVITLIPGFGGADFGANAQTLGEVAGEPITIAQLRTSMSQLARGADVRRDQLSSMLPVAFRNLVQERALLYEANRLGFNVTDEDLAGAIQSIPTFNRNGQFVGADEYRMILEQNGMTPAMFEQNVRKELVSGRLGAMVSRTVVVSDAEVDAVLKERHETATVQFVYIEPDTLLSQVTPSQEDVDRYYERAQNKVRIAESRDFDVVRISIEKAMAASPVSMNEVKAFYDANMEQWRLDEQVNLRHILLSTEGKSGEQKQELRKKAEGLLAQLKSGADFAKLARENSTDQASAKEGGELGWIFRGQTEPAFEQAAFALKPGGISDVVETVYGFHIIKSEGYEPAKVRTLDTVRDEIAGQLTRQRAMDLMQQTADRLRSQAIGNVGNLTAIVNAEPLAQLSSYTSIPNNAPVGSIGGALQLRQEMNDLAEGQVTSVSDAGGNSLAFAVVRKVNPDREATIEEVRARVTQSLKTQLATQLAEKKLFEAREAIVSGADLRTVARNMGLTFMEPPAFTRISAVEGIGNAGDIYTAFDQPVGGVIGPFRAATRMVVAKVIGKQGANLAEHAGERDQIRKQLGTVKSQERLQIYLEGVRLRLEKEGKIKIDNQKVTALMQGGLGL